MTEKKQTGRVQLYACGGMGMNIGRANEKFRGISQPGFAELNISYIDTSDSNNRRSDIKLDPKYCYFFDGIDGSGQDRTANLPVIIPAAKDILQKHKPADLNIILHSASGGSGSSIGPVLAELLLAKGENVVVIMTGDVSTIKFAKNVRGTIKTYINVAENVVKEPVPAVYFNITDKTPRRMVDEAIGHFLGSLLVLASRQNHELDTADIRNFLRFSNPKVTSFRPQLALLSLAAGDSVPDVSGNIISVATLATESSGTTISPRPEYQVTGFLPTDVEHSMSGNAPIHFVISDGFFHQELPKVENLIAAHEEEVSSRVPQHSLLKADDKAAAGSIID